MTITIKNKYPVILLNFREDFNFDKGVKSGPSVLKGASGALRKGNKKNGEWHGAATYTSPDGEVTQERWEMGRKQEV